MYIYNRQTMCTLLVAIGKFHTFEWILVGNEFYLFLSWRVGVSIILRLGHNVSSLDLLKVIVPIPVKISFLV
jgi:hypothetical protein